MKKVIVGALLFASCATAPVKPPMLDLKITNGRILDGREHLEFPAVHSL